MTDDAPVDDTEELESDEVADEAVQSRVADEHLRPTSAEEAEGQRLGEAIDTEDDEDAGSSG